MAADFGCSVSSLTHCSVSLHNPENKSIFIDQSVLNHEFKASKNSLRKCSKMNNPNFWLALNHIEMLIMFRKQTNTPNHMYICEKWCWNQSVTDISQHISSFLFEINKCLCNFLFINIFTLVIFLFTGFNFFSLCSCAISQPLVTFPVFCHYFATLCYSMNRTKHWVSRGGRGVAAWLATTWSWQKKTVNLQCFGCPSHSLFMLCLYIIPRRAEIGLTSFNKFAYIF